MALGKRVYEYRGEQFEVIRTSPDSATVSRRCEECDHEDFIIGTIEGQTGWLIGQKESGEGPRGPIDTFSEAVDWCCYMLLMECRSIVYVDEFFAEDIRTSQGGLDASMPLSADKAGGTTLAKRVCEHGEREFEVIRTSLESVTVSLDCEKHNHHDLIVDMSVHGMTEWVISRAGDLLVQDGTFAGDEFATAVEYCCDSLLRECEASVQIDGFFSDHVRTLQESADVAATLPADEGGNTALANRLYEYRGAQFEVIRTSPDSATVNLKCEKHNHEIIIVGRTEGESGWLVGREADPLGPIDIFINAVEHSAEVLVGECEAFVQLDEFFEEGILTLKERLDALAAFLPQFEVPAFEFGRMESPPGAMPYYTFSPLASCFIKTCYEMDWVKAFEWAEWKNTPEAAQLRDDPSVLEKATFEQLSRLLTVLIRQDRFVEGALGSAFESGLLSGILRRAAVLAADSQDTEPQRSSVSE